jgi:crotonobetainyl-CoA:carnitine CoA-transferase CaiB-like acyl-CoA transferase
MPDSAHQTLVPFQAFAAADGWLVLACPKEALWRGLCDAIEQPELALDERFTGLAARDQRRDELIPILKDAFRRRPVSEWIERLTANGVPCAPVNDVAGALADPQAAAREAVVSYEHPVLGKVRTPANPIRLGDEEPRLDRAPFLGEHTVEILSEVCGYSPARIDELVDLGAVCAMEPEAERR